MANLKISALPTTTSSTFNDWLVKNDSGETTTSKVQLKYVLGMTSLNGNNAVQSSSWLTLLGTTATTESAIAIGNGAEATSPYSIAIGYRARNDNRDGTRNNYICIGTDSRAVQESFALGTGAKALGASTLSVGENAQTYGNSGFAMGKNSNSQGTSAIALGHGAIAVGDRSIAIGTDASVTAPATEGIAIGRNTTASADASVAIGDGSVADSVGCVVFQGLNSNPSGFTDTVFCRSIQTQGNTTDATNTQNGGSGFTVNFDVSSSQKIVLDQNATLTLTNIRDGGRYRLLLENNGTHNLSSVTASGYTIKYSGGGRDPLTHNSDDLWYLDVFANEIYITQNANYTT
jgi:hypothetical protein